MNMPITEIKGRTWQCLELRCNKYFFNEDGVCPHCGRKNQRLPRMGDRDMVDLDGWVMLNRGGCRMRATHR